MCPRHHGWTPASASITFFPFCPLGSPWQGISGFPEAVEAVGADPCPGGTLGASVRADRSDGMGAGQHTRSPSPSGRVEIASRQAPRLRMSPYADGRAARSPSYRRLRHGRDAVRDAPRDGRPGARRSAGARDRSARPGVEHWRAIDARRAGHRACRGRALAGALAYSALGLLAAVVVHSVSRTHPADRSSRRLAGRTVAWTAYGSAALAGLIHLRAAATGAPLPSPLALEIDLPASSL